ncbi:hypothetical protein BGZ97_007822, partial [Linnemannia gamsii]
MFFVRLCNVPSAKLDQHTITNVASRDLKHGRVVHAQLLAIIADCDFIAICIEFSRKFFLKMRRYDMMDMI